MTTGFARLLVARHASLVAREEGVSFSKVWRLAERECIELTGGRDAKGYKRLSPERRGAVEAALRANPQATQLEIARATGVTSTTGMPWRRASLISHWSNHARPIARGGTSRYMLGGNAKTSIAV